MQISNLMSFKELLKTPKTLHRTECVLVVVFTRSKINVVPQRDFLVQTWGPLPSVLQVNPSFSKLAGRPILPIF